MLFYLYLSEDGTRVSAYERGILPIYTMKYLGIIPFMPKNQLQGLKEKIESTLISVLGSDSSKIYRVKIFTRNYVGIPKS